MTRNIIYTTTINIVSGKSRNYEQQLKKQLDQMNLLVEIQYSDSIGKDPINYANEEWGDIVSDQMCLNNARSNNYVKILRKYLAHYTLHKPNNFRELRQLYRRYFMFLDIFKDYYNEEGPQDNELRYWYEATYDVDLKAW